jgi:hypothetical protein
VHPVIYSCTSSCLRSSSIAFSWLCFRLFSIPFDLLCPTWFLLCYGFFPNVWSYFVVRAKRNLCTNSLELQDPQYLFLSDNCVHVPTYVYCCLKRDTYRMWILMASLNYLHPSRSHPHRLKRGAELVKFCTYTSCIVPFSTPLSLSCGNSWSSAAYVQPDHTYPE